MQISLESWRDELVKAGLPDDIVWLMNYLFGTVLDGRNAEPADGVRRALGREATDVATFIREAAASGLWNQAPGEAA